MIEHPLNGPWTARAAGGKGPPFAAAVPGCVHTDLLAAGLIPDPFFRDQEKEQMWIAETDWIYERVFDVPEETLAEERVLLRCEGLDTLASLRVNGRKIGRTDNMFRTWEFDVGRLLRPGANRLLVRFDAPMPYLRRMNRIRPLPSWGGKERRDFGGWIRKQPCNFGWDWGPKTTTCGIWRDIRLLAFSSARCTDLQILQQHARGRVRLRIEQAVERTNPHPLRVQFEVRLDGRVVASAATPVEGASARADLRIPAPRLWWPNGLGQQPLYEVTADLLDGTGQLLDTATRRIGLRTLRLERKPDRWGESFRFTVNGVPFFAKGANWIPGDALVTRMTFDDYARLLEDAAAAHMNMLRVWGGGIYEDDRFYNLCDELGLCVWQDFMFACAAYPSFDRAFMENVAAEARDNVRRIRHHPCLALWCGNNELEQGLVGDAWTDRTMSWKDYRRLFDRLLPDIVRREDPGRDTWPSSPHTPGTNRKDYNDPTRGDAHLWNVWHGSEPFEWYRSCTHRFNSEFGFQSFPEPRSVAAFTQPGDRNLTHPVMEWHQRSPPGNRRIIATMAEWFRMPSSFDDFLWLSQIQQGMAIAVAVEAWRRSMPRGMGTLYWQLNDNWPAASWSSIDHAGRWKALHYMARRFYAPVLVSGVEDAARGRVAVHLTNDRSDPVRVRLQWSLTTVRGEELARARETLTLRPRASRKTLTLDVRDLLERLGPEELMVWLCAEENGRERSDALVLFAKPKQLELEDPRWAASVSRVNGNDYRVTIRARAPALWAWITLDETDVRCSDNFFHLQPGRPKQVLITPAIPLTPAECRRRLRIRSLFDLQGKRPNGGGKT